MLLIYVIVSILFYSIVDLPDIFESHFQENSFRVLLAILHFIFITSFNDLWQINQKQSFIVGSNRVKQVVISLSMALVIPTLLKLGIVINDQSSAFEVDINYLAFPCLLLLLYVSVKMLSEEGAYPRVFTGNNVGHIDNFLLGGFQYLIYEVSLLTISLLGLAMLFLAIV